MNSSNVDERAWFVFALPKSTAYVPAMTEEAGRGVLVRDSYKNAPVHEWPCTGSRWTSRDALTAELLRKAAP